ncbi:dipeptidase [Rhodobacter ferrooxidans]|uniref:Peptidase M19 renal dipeptidase n=1 Tax=Rhodobacter ferrooxidans TaxID=371731 RepID=C8RZ91_9RHOB|nr:dipeptidase [Rhodobacter sp. SW2]EEW26048.1 peptidase M19 renal dipeptidase [Rhodobacter sp. SW2]
MIPVFDGHNDILLKLLRCDPAMLDATWLVGDGAGHLDLARMRKGGFAGGFFAIYIPSPRDGQNYDAMMDHPPYDVPLPPLIDAPAAQPTALAMAGILLRMERVSQGGFKVCRTTAEVRDCLARGVVAGIMHMEGAEAIGPDLDALYSFHALGLRSIGPVWSRPTVFGHGVPFRFPGDPDTGPGLTEVGKDLIRACNALKIMVDLSHINEAGFNDVAAISDAPLVATHSNAHAITPSTRNLTDRQLAVIRDSGGMVGLNFATVFLRPDGRQSPEMDWQPVLRHLDHLITHLGEDHVGFGSDFDGATIPQGIGDVTGLPDLLVALSGHGYDAPLLHKLASENWLSLLDRTWGA